MIAKVKAPSQFYQSAFWASTSLFVAAVIFLLTIPATEEREWVRISGWTMFVLFPISSVISLLVWKKEKSDFSASIEQIKEEIEYIEGKYLSGDEDLK